MPLSARERLPFELASKILSHLAIGDVDNLQLLRRLFPKLDAVALLEARKDPLNYLAGYFIKPRCILHAMLLCNAHIYGQKAADYFIPPPKCHPRAEFDVLISRGMPTDRRFLSKQDSRQPWDYHSDFLCFNSILFVMKLIDLGLRLIQYPTDEMILYDEITLSRIYVRSCRFVEIEDVLLLMPYSPQMCCLGGWGALSLYHDYTRKQQYFQNNSPGISYQKWMHINNCQPDLCGWKKIKLPSSYHREWKSWRLFQDIGAKRLRYRKLDDWTARSAYAKHQNISTCGSVDCKIVSFGKSLDITCRAAKLMAQCTAERLLSVEWLEKPNALFGPLARQSHTYSERLNSLLSTWRLSNISTDRLVNVFFEIGLCHETSYNPSSPNGEYFDLMLRCKALSGFWSELRFILQDSNIPNVSPRLT